MELRYADFGICAADEIVNQAAKIRYMLGGQVRVPAVIRQPIGLRDGMAAQHSQSTEAWWVHVPGLVVVAPSTPADNHALLKAAIRCDDPVVYMEHKELWTVSGEVDEAAEPAQLGKARVIRSGRDVTIVTWSSMAGVCLGAANASPRTGAKPKSSTCAPSGVGQGRRVPIGREDRATARGAPGRARRRVRRGDRGGSLGASLRETQGGAAPPWRPSRPGALRRAAGDDVPRE